MVDPGTPSGLKRDALGTSSLVFIVVSAAAPLMVMVGVAPLAILVGGLGAPTAYLFAGVVLAVFAVGFTTMSRHVTNAGAFYSYIAIALGKPAGIAAALVALLSYNVLQIGVYGLMASVADSTFRKVFGLDLPWWTYALAAVALVWYVGFRSVDFGAKVLAVMLIAEIGVLFVLAVAILAQGGSAEGIGLDSFKPSEFTGPGMEAILPIAFAAFIGFEATIIYRSETRHPRRTIPRATYAAVAVLAVTYAFIVWSIIQAFGAKGIIAAAATDPVDLFFVASDTYVGTWFTIVVHLLLVTSVLAGLVAFHNAVTRYALAMTEEGLLPKRLAAVHPRTRTPYVAGIVQTVVAFAVVAGFAIADADPYRQLLMWVNTPGVYGIILLQVTVAVSVVVYFRRTRTGESAWHTVVAPVLSALAMIVAFVFSALHADMISGASDTVNVILVGITPLTAVGGLVWALWLRARRPVLYSAISTHGTTAEAPTALDATARETTDLKLKEN